MFSHLQYSEGNFEKFVRVRVVGLIKPIALFFFLITINLFSYPLVFGQFLVDYCFFMTRGIWNIQNYDQNLILKIEQNWVSVIILYFVDSSRHYKSIIQKNMMTNLQMANKFEAQVRKFRQKK